MEIELLRVAYRRTEQQTLICLLLSLPLFAEAAYKYAATKPLIISSHGVG